jgi:hypothetical protein
MTSVTILDPIGALLVHPDGDFMGNVLWPADLPADHLAALPAALAAITARGYFASPFPEGDGVTFKRKDGRPYEPEVALADFRTDFAFLDLNVPVAGESTARALARLAGDRTATCTYLAPVEGLHLIAPFQLGQTRFHPPVDGVDNRLAGHAWRQLCDVPGADVNPDWTPGVRARGTTELLAHPLIERRIEVPLSVLYLAGDSVSGQSALLRLVMEDADHALDPVRFDLCHFRRLEYLPAKPGWIGEFALAYVRPAGRALPERLLQGKPYVLRVSNTWLGLEVDGGALGAAEGLADIVDSTATDEITLALKSALRAWSRAFYLVELEASFLHLVYAIDALCEPGGLRGDRHRLWISALASGGEAARFALLLSDFDSHYRVRNRIVHEGQTFAGLGLVGEEQCQFMLGLLGRCIQTFLIQGFASRHDAAAFAFGALTSPEIAPLVAALGSPQIKLPLTADKDFKRHMQP